VNSSYAHSEMRIKVQNGDNPFLRRNARGMACRLDWEYIGS